MQDQMSLILRRYATSKLRLVLLSTYQQNLHCQAMKKTDSSWGELLNQLASLCSSQKVYIAIHTNINRDASKEKKTWKEIGKCSLQHKHLDTNQDMKQGREGEMHL